MVVVCALSLQNRSICDGVTLLGGEEDAAGPAESHREIEILRTTAWRFAKVSSSEAPSLLLSTQRVLQLEGFGPFGELTIAAVGALQRGPFC